MGIINTAIIEEIVSLRQEHAELLGYPDHAIYIQEVRMVKNPETVKELLAGLASKVKQLWEEEHRVMLQMKKEESEELGIEYNGETRLLGLAGPSPVQNQWAVVSAVEHRLLHNKISHNKISS